MEEQLAAIGVGNAGEEAAAPEPKRRGQRRLSLAGRDERETSQAALDVQAEVNKASDDKLGVLIRCVAQNKENKCEADPEMTAWALSAMGVRTYPSSSSSSPSSVVC